MTDKTVAWIMMGVGTGQVLLLVAMLATLDDGGMPKPRRRPRRCDRPFGLAGLVGVIMSALDDALARFTAFVKEVVTQLTATKDTNDTQTGKIAELQVALESALSDDAADAAAINALQAEIANLQDSVAAQINSAIDALQNPIPAVDPVDPPVTPDITVPPVDFDQPVVVVEEAPVVVEEAPVVAEEAVVADDEAAGTTS